MLVMEMSKKEQQVPTIRFKGFTETWEQRKVRELFTVTRGQVLAATRTKEKETNNFIYPVYSSQTKNNGLMGFYDQYLFEDAITWTTDGANAGTVNFRKGKFYSTNVNGVLLSDEGFANNAVAEIINKIAWKHVSKVGNPKLMNNVMAEITVAVPSIEEQNKLSSLFRQLDDTIALHQRKLSLLDQLKQAYLQKMFPNNGEIVPTLRIAGFTEPWEQRRLGDVAERVRGNDGRMNLPTLTISAGSGWLDQRERFSGNIAGNEQQNYTLLSKGELSYNHGNSKLAKYGAVFTLRTFNEALVPRVYHSFRTNYFATADFIEFMFATKRPDSELAKLVSSGARMDGLLNINYDDFMGIDIIIPKLEEQNRISNFLRRFDDTITLHRQKVSQLQALKNSLLNKMFI